LKALVLTGSRADRNGLEVLHNALLRAGHYSELSSCFSRFNGKPDVVILGGDRIEVLSYVVGISELGIPIAHLAGGDVTEGSADDRYRDAITALSCIHFATNFGSHCRLVERLGHRRDSIYLTGSPAIDRIQQTPVFDKDDTMNMFYMHCDRPVALVCVHPNTIGRDPCVDARITIDALKRLNLQCIVLGPNADRGGKEVEAMIQEWRKGQADRMVSYWPNVSAKLYYSLMTHCDVMVGNSSAGYYEAPSFGLPVVQVGNRQHGRMAPDNVVETVLNADYVTEVIQYQLDSGRCVDCRNPYGQGHSAPLIVAALEENNWRWEK
jgi:UDP-hydrolysing UDP-N-acetyl-D-glucosamine 2-epimerase